MHPFLNTLSFICRHPLNRTRRARALLGYLRWQIGSRMVPGAVAVPFVGTTRLLARRGMAGATGNVYCGLHEFEDMAFVLHVLRPGDLLVDVGANVGSYTVLAAGACGARVLSIEPIPSTFARLGDNIRLNDLDRLVDARNVGLGASSGVLRFSTDLDSENHVLAGAESGEASGLAVPVCTLDSLVADSSPILIKIDAEGYETEVLRGAEQTLRRPTVQAVLMELNGNGARYGFDEERLHRLMLEHGFAPGRYEPFRRALTRADGRNRVGNTLYVRDLDALRARVESAPRHQVQGVSL